MRVTVIEGREGGRERGGGREREGGGEREGDGDHHRNDRSDGLGRRSTTCDLPDVAGMNEPAHINAYSIVYDLTKGL